MSKEPVTGLDTPQIDRADVALPTMSYQMRPGERDQNIGTFDNHAFLDAARVLHYWCGCFYKANNNLTWVRYRQYAGGSLLVEHNLSYGPTEPSDPDFLKLAGFEIVQQGRAFIVTPRGHVVNPESPFRAQGCVTGEPFVLDGVFAPFLNDGTTLPTPPRYNPNEVIFSDVPKTNPFHEGINMLSKIGAVSGYEDGTFKWEQFVTRGQMCKVVWNAIKYILGMLHK